MDLTGALTVFGPLGIGCLALGYAYWKLLERHLALHEKRASESATFLVETTENTKAMANMTNVLAIQGEALKADSRANEALTQAVRELKSDIQQLKTTIEARSPRRTA